MTAENEEKSPWDSLVSELGVEITSDAVERRQPTPQEVKSQVAVQSKPAAPKPLNSDWDALASNLGIEVPKEQLAATSEPAAKSPPPKPTRPTMPPAPQASREPRAERRPESKSESRSDRRSESKSEPRPPRSERRPPIVEIIEDEPVFTEIVDEADVPDAEPERPTISGEAARSAFDALFSPESSSWGSAMVSPRTNVESSFLFDEGEQAYFAEDIPETGTGDQDDTGEESAEATTDERRPRRRRRGSRGRGRRGERTARDTDELSTEPLAGEADSESDPDTDSQRSPLEPESEDSSEKHRRRRPRTRRGPPKEGATETDRPTSSRPPRSAAKESDEFDSDLEHEDESDELDGEPASHRNLPTWSDAISVIVESNILQRSKTPERNTPSPRGRSRGGRRHKKS